MLNIEDIRLRTTIKAVFLTLLFLLQIISLSLMSSFYCLYSCLIYKFTSGTIVQVRNLKLGTFQPNNRLHSVVFDDWVFQKALTSHPSEHSILCLILSKNRISINNRQVTVLGKYCKIHIWFMHQSTTYICKTFEKVWQAKSDIS